METNEKLNNWDNYISGTFLKPANVNNEQQPFVAIEIEEFFDKRDNSTRVRINLESGAEQDFIFDLNKTNSMFLKNNGIKRPLDIIGRRLYFRKVLVRNPKSNIEVESLRICKVE